ncbi:MAG: hypothetical protein JWO56_1683, partial [Acidobacteria bacterium]|nr:hypothetical protein [Acidobacteriota bacterium]
MSFGEPTSLDDTGGGGPGTPGAPGANGWSPALAVVADGARRVHQVVDWFGGTGTKPATGKYIGAAGLTTVLADAVDVRGGAGANGNNGNDGAAGLNAWSPVLAVANDGARRIHQVVDWIGGGGVKPATGQYIGAAGYVDLIADGVDVRGVAGASGGDGNDGAPGENGLDAWTAVLAVVADGARRVHQVVDWTGGGGGKPATGSYLGPAGFVAAAADATDIRGATGTGGANGNDGAPGANGLNAWSPAIAVVADGARRVHQVVDWFGGGGTKPATGKYLGPVGFVDAIADAADVRGAAGTNGTNGLNGNDGSNGLNAWTPVLAIVNDGARRVQQVIDWTGGGGTKPATGQYVGAAGFTGVLANGVDIRGAAGANGGDGSPGAAGVDAWTPALAIVADGARRVQQVVDWFGGSGTKPATGQYVGAIGFTVTLANGIDIRGAAGTNGTNGADGSNGLNAWTPVLSIVNDGARRVLQVSDWTGGGGAKPTTGQYVSATGFTVTIADGIDVRGPAGAGGANGADGMTVLSTNGAPANGTGANGDFAYDGAAKVMYGPKAAGVWPAGVSLAGTNGTNGVDGNTVLYGSGVPASGTGVNGNFYIDKDAWTIYGPKAAGAWPAGVSIFGLSIKAFGALGDGATDDTTAIQAALNSGAPAIYVPSTLNSFKFSTLTMPTTPYFVLFGDGPSSKMKQTGAGIKWAGTAINYGEQTIRGIHINGVSGTGHSIDTSYQGGTTLKDLYFTDVPVGYASINIDGNATTYTHDIRVDGVQVYFGSASGAGLAGIRLGAKASDVSINNFIMNGGFLVQHGIYAADGALTTRVSNSHPYNTTATCFYGNSTAAAVGFSFTNCAFDNVNTGPLVSMTNFQDATFTNCRFQAINAGRSGVLLANCKRVSFTDPVFQAAAGATSMIVESAGSDYT